MTRLAVAVMCRVPHGGGGKSRLREHLDARFVEELQAAMLDDTFASLETTHAADKIAFVAPSRDFAAAEAMARYLPPGWSAVEQEGADLGARILHALRCSFDLGAARVVVTGADAPLLSLPHGELLTLAEDEALVVPTDDGGYAAIGLARPEPSLFVDMPWSTSAVMAETRRRATACGLRVRELPRTFDIDEPADVERLRAELARRPSLVLARAPATASLLSQARA